MCYQCIITLLLLFLAVIRSQVNELPILLTLMNINLLVSYIYVIINYRYIFRNHNSEKSVASFNFLNVFEKAKIGLFVGTAVYIMFITYTIVQIYNNEQLNEEFLLISWLIISCALACVKGAYLDSATIFFDDYYISGKYWVSYKELDRIDVIREYSNILGKIYLIELFKDGRSVGFDKFYVQEFDFLKSKLSQIA
jgi:hypothetical protein